MNASEHTRRQLAIKARITHDAERISLLTRVATGQPANCRIV